MAGDDHAARCHTAADPVRAPASQSSGANPSDSEEMDCCDETAGIVNLAPSGELRARAPYHVAALFAAAPQLSTPGRVSLDTGPDPGPHSPYPSVNPPLLN